MEKFKEILLLKNLKRVGKVTIYKKYWNLLKNSKNLDDLIIKLESDFTKEEILKAKKSALDTYEYVIDSDIHVITVFDRAYPQKLLDMENKRPLILYVKGNLEALTKTNIAVIGTRKPSRNSQNFEENLVKNILNNQDIAIVSGLALGCDKIAHQTTVDLNKATIAVLPSGVNVIKPASNKKLAKDIIDGGGCLISEYEPNAKVFRGNYVERDNIVAAFSDATLVIECGIKSGTMHTVNAAEKYKRQIFAYLPESYSKDTYDGNEFILNNKNSILVRNVHDLKNLRKKLKSNQQTLI